MSLTDLPKTIATVALNLIRVPLTLIERAVPGRSAAERAADPVTVPPKAPKPAARRKPAAKKPATAKGKPAKPDAGSAPRTTPAEEGGVVDESTDGLAAATDRAVAAREDLEQSASRDG